MSFQLKKYTAPDFSKEIFQKAPNVKLVPAPADTVAPEQFHAMSIFPEYFKVDGQWLLAKDSRMDCVPVYRDGEILVIEPRHLKKGDLVVVGRTEKCQDGIFVHANGFGAVEKQGDVFAFRQNRSRETSFSKDYDELYELLRYEKEHGGNILWVMGPAFSFDADARTAFSKLIEHGYVNGVMAGNALATHDLEGAYMNTALGQDIYTQETMENGHYNHLTTINRVRACGSIREFIEKEHIDNGIIYNCMKYNVPLVLAAAGEKEFAARTAEMTAVNRGWMTEKLRACGYTVFPSCTNYLLFSGPVGLVEYAVAHGYLIRDCSNFRGLETNKASAVTDVRQEDSVCGKTGETRQYYRICIRSQQENEGLLAVLAEFVK